MTKQALYGELTKILIKGSSRGTGRTMSPAEAKIVLDDMIASDDSEFWNGVRTDPAAPPSPIPGDARAILAKVIAIYRSM
jgi:hypothetical protein